MNKIKLMTQEAIKNFTILNFLGFLGRIGLAILLAYGVLYEKHTPNSNIFLFLWLCFLIFQWLTPRK